MVAGAARPGSIRSFRRWCIDSPRRCEVTPGVERWAGSRLNRTEILRQAQDDTREWTPTGKAAVIGHDRFTDLHRDSRMQAHLAPQMNLSCDARRGSGASTSSYPFTAPSVNPAMKRSRKRL